MSGDCFWSEGITFSCARCSACCRYDEGYVFLYEKDIAPILKKLHIDYESFAERYCRWVDLHDGYEYLSIQETPSYDCVFWSEGCTIYEVRPLQCKAYPFWPDALRSKETWHSVLKGCKAYRGFGRSKVANDKIMFHPAGEIAALRNEQLQAKKIRRERLL